MNLRLLIFTVSFVMLALLHQRMYTDAAAFISNDGAAEERLLRSPDEEAKDAPEEEDAKAGEAEPNKEDAKGDKDKKKDGSKGTKVVQKKVKKFKDTFQDFGKKAEEKFKEMKDFFAP